MISPGFTLLLSIVLVVVLYFCSNFQDLFFLASCSEGIKGACVSLAQSPCLPSPKTTRPGFLLCFEWAGFLDRGQRSTYCLLTVTIRATCTSKSWNMICLLYIQRKTCYKAINVCPPLKKGKKLLDLRNGKNCKESTMYSSWFTHSYALVLS